MALTTLVYAVMLRKVERTVRDAHHRAAVRTWHQPCLGSLSLNEIGDAGAQALAAALPSCVALTTLVYAAMLRKQSARSTMLTTHLPCSRGVNPALPA